MGVRVDDILKRPFLMRTFEQRLWVVAEGKPRPILKLDPVVTMKNETGGEEFCTRQFDPDMYDEVEWLTGCEKRHAFFCWPCLLFMPPNGLWNTSGISKLADYLEAMPEHQETSDHVQAMLKLQNMTMEHKVKTSVIDVGKHNEMVKRNRAILKRMMDVVCNLLIKEQHSYERINGCQLHPESVVNNLQLLRIYDSTDCNFIEDAVDLIQMTPNIVNDLVDTITRGIKMAITKEIQASTYVSIILSNHSESAVNSQISVILRYIKASKVCERFVGFVNMADVKSVSTVYELISNVINEFSLTEKLVSIAIDGGIADVLELNQMIKSTYPYTLFVPWYGHKLNYVLQQSFASIDKCDVFFKTMNEMEIYFNVKSKPFIALDNYMNVKLRPPYNTTWFVKSQFIKVVNNRTRHLTQFLETVLQDTIKWEPDELSKAAGFKLFLEEMEALFLLETFAMLFECTSTFSNVLKSSSPEKYISYEIVKTVQTNLRNMRDGRFANIWSKMISKMAIAIGDKTKLESLYNEKEKYHEYYNLYNIIINHVRRELDARFSKTNNLSFCQLLSCDELGNFTFSNDMIQSLMLTYGAFFDEEQLRNELLVLQTHGTVFFKKSLYDILDFLTETKLKDSFQYMYKLAALILTLPIKTPSDGAASTKFEEIRSWSYVPEAAGPQSGDVSIPCVEKDFMKELKKSIFFHHESAEIFYELNKTFDLINL